jgi:hypothetical protein
MLVSAFPSSPSPSQASQEKRRNEWLLNPFLHPPSEQAPLITPISENKRAKAEQGTTDWGPIWFLAFPGNIYATTIARIGNRQCTFPRRDWQAFVRTGLGDGNVCP